MTLLCLQESSLEDNVVIKNEIRIKLGQGIAGMVALTGNTLNIPDAYKVLYCVSAFCEDNNFTIRPSHFISSYRVVKRWFLSSKF